MIDIEKMVSTLSIPDGMTVDEMRRIVVDVLDMAKASNEAEKAIATENAALKTENDRLSKQNLELFNRVTDLLIQDTAISNHKNGINHRMTILFKSDQLMRQPCDGI